MKVDVKPGARGQFDVLVDGVLVASKHGTGALARLIGQGGFPDEQLTVEAVDRQLGEAD
ncbi:MAG: Rdx family protein [Deltaproteobacteria bacterium]|nr:Rdx family protein [Deltaproteobacteria bacterium]